jgi:hypothetical protein
MRHPAPPLLALALLGLAGLGCAAANAFQPAPSPTIIPTASVSPSSLPTFTPPPTRTPVPSPTTAASVATRVLADGSTEFIDSEAGYRLVLPPQWLVLDLGSEDMEQALGEAAELNPQFGLLITAFGTMASQGMRLMAFELDPRSVAIGYPTNVVLVNLEGMGFPIEQILEGTAQSIEALFPGSELIDSRMIEDLNGSPAGRIELTMPLTTAAGTSVTIRSTWILVQAGDRLIELTLQAEDSLYLEDETRFEHIIESLELLGP